MFTTSTVSGLMTAALLAFGVTAAQAASLSIRPMVVTLNEKEHSAALTLKNEGSEARVIQTELLLWTQENGENVYTPTRDMLVNPPIATLQSGQTQLIRIGLNRKVDKIQELAYRLYVSEVPSPPMEGFTGLNIALRLGIAVFVSPKAERINKLDWEVTRSPEGAPILTLRNSGNYHLRLISLKVRDPNNGQQLTEWQQSPVTLLAGQTHQINLSLPHGWKGKYLSLVASTDMGLTETKIELDQTAR